MKLRTTLVSVSLASGLLLTGCAEATDTPPASEQATTAPTSAAPSTSESAQGVTVEITLEKGSYDPQGKTVEVPLGEPVTLEITADAKGELHVHSSPETSVEFGVGETTRTLTFDKPGVIEVESHDTGVVVIQLQVS